MVKKILSVLLCLVLAMGFCGCNLFTRNFERDYQRVIVEVPETVYSSSDEPGIPYLTYKNGVTYYFNANEVYTRTSVDMTMDSFKLYGDSEGKNNIYAYPEDLSDSELQEIKDIFGSYLENDSDTFAEKYPDYSGKIGRAEFSATIPVRKIYKTELANYINNYAQTYINSYGYTVERTINTLLDQLISERALLLNEAVKFYVSGKIVMTQTDYNNIERSLYASIDSELSTLQSEILEEKDKPVPDYDAEEEEAGETTWPVPEEDAEVEENYNEPVWSIENEKNRWPGVVGDLEIKSLELESVRRYLLQLEDSVNGDFRLSDEQRDRIARDFENLRNIQNTQGIEFVYPALGKTFVIDYVYRSGIIDNYLVNRVRSYIEGELSGHITVSDREIEEKYNEMLNEQRTSYADISKYDTAIDNEDTILYHPDTERFFFVKHILLQFSDEQKAYLDSYNKNPNHNEEDKKRERNELAKEITAYAHKDGEDDTSTSYTVNQIFTEVKASVGKYASNPYLAMKEFDRLIYKYNQDPGSFNKVNGYAVRTSLGEGDTDNWVEEFSAAARSLNSDGVEGAIYFEPIVTDYGVHIMFYVGKIKKSVISLNDYTNFARKILVKDEISSDLFNTKVSNAYSDWEEANITSQIKDESKVIIYRKVFRDFYEE